MCWTILTYQQWCRGGQNTTKINKRSSLVLWFMSRHKKVTCTTNDSLSISLSSPTPLSPVSSCWVVCWKMLRAIENIKKQRREMKRQGGKGNVTFIFWFSLECIWESHYGGEIFMWWNIPRAISFFIYWCLLYVMLCIN